MAGPSPGRTVLTSLPRRSTKKASRYKSGINSVSRSNMRDVFLLEPTTTVPFGASYIASYPHLIDYFSDKAEISPGDVVRAAHMAYGWMPTILDLYLHPDRLDLATASDLLTKAKNDGELQASEISDLAGLVNNSLVGASKLCTSSHQIVLPSGIQMSTHCLRKAARTITGQYMSNLHGLP